MLRLFRRILGRLCLFLLLVFPTAESAAATDWLIGRVDSIDASAGTLMLNLEPIGLDRNDSTRLHFAREDATWIRRGGAIVGKRELVAGDPWLTGLWPLADESLALLAGDLASRERSDEDWLSWIAIDQSGKAKSLQERSQTGAVLLFLPLGTRTEAPWIKATLNRFFAWQQSNVAYRELSEVGWLVVSTTPEQDSRQSVEQWRMKASMTAVEEDDNSTGSVVDWLTLFPQSDATVHSAFQLPFFVTEGQPVVSLPQWVVIDRRGETRVSWQGWEPPLVEWTAILRDR
jgi:hypothetical protein